MELQKRITSTQDYNLVLETCERSNHISYNCLISDEALLPPVTTARRQAVVNHFYMPIQFNMKNGTDTSDSSSNNIASDED
jgi:hypothetical protein